MRLARAFLLTLVLLIVPAMPAAAADGFMSLQDFQFAPALAEIQPGEKVSFNFEGPSPHSAVLRRGQIDRYASGVTGPGMTKAHRFRYAGSFALLCGIHPEMTARVRVGTPEAAKPRLTSLRARPDLRRVRLALRISERSVITVAIGTKRVTKVLDAGARSITVRGLRRGRRSARLSATDGWANKSATVRKSFRVR